MISATSTGMLRQNANTKFCAQCKLFLRTRLDEGDVDFRETGVDSGEGDLDLR